MFVIKKSTFIQKKHIKFQKKLQFLGLMGTELPIELMMYGLPQAKVTSFFFFYTLYSCINAY